MEKSASVQVLFDTYWANMQVKRLLNDIWKAYEKQYKDYIDLLDRTNWWNIYQNNEKKKYHCWGPSDYCNDSMLSETMEDWAGYADKLHKQQCPYYDKTNNALPNCSYVKEEMVYYSGSYSIPEGLYPRPIPCEYYDVKTKSSPDCPVYKIKVEDKHTCSNWRACKQLHLYCGCEFQIFSGGYNFDAYNEYLENVKSFGERHLHEVEDSLNRQALEQMLQMLPQGGDMPMMPDIQLSPFNPTSMIPNLSFPKMPDFPDFNPSLTPLQNDESGMFKIKYDPPNPNDEGFMLKGFNIGGFEIELPNWENYKLNESIEVDLSEYKSLLPANAHNGTTVVNPIWEQTRWRVNLNNTGEGTSTMQVLSKFDDSLIKEGNSVYLNPKTDYLKVDNLPLENFKVSSVFTGVGLIEYKGNEYAV